MNVNIAALGHTVTGNWAHKKTQYPIVKRQTWISCHLALDTLAVEVELLFILSGKNPDRFLSSVKTYHKNKQSMSLCGQPEKD